MEDGLTKMEELMEDGLTKMEELLHFDGRWFHQLLHFFKNGGADGRWFQLLQKNGGAPPFLSNHLPSAPPFLTKIQQLLHF